MNKIYQKIPPNVKSGTECILGVFSALLICGGVNRRPSLWKDEIWLKFPFGRLRRAGFTLTELLIVVLVVGILAAAAWPQYRIAVAKSRFAQLEILGNAIARAEEAYFMQNGVYTNDFTALVPSVPGKVTNHSVRFGNGSCSVLLGKGDDGMEYSEFYCVSQVGWGKADVPMYIRSLGAPHRFCRASTLNKTDVSHRVCLSLGGTLTGCSNKNAYCQYLLP